MTGPPPDAAQLRSAMGQFATGVTVVCLRDDDDDVGLTSTSFTSVSLVPPMVLVSVSTSSYVDELFARCERWAVSVLAESQLAVAGRFAAAGRPSARLLLSGLAHHRGARSEALIVADGVLGLECRTTDQFEEGDHRLVVGLVESIDYVTDHPPLVRHRSDYRGLGPAGA